MNRDGRTPTGVATPSTNSAAIPRFDTLESDTIHLTRQRKGAEKREGSKSIQTGEDIDPEVQPSKLRLRLRNLAPKSANTNSNDTAQRKAKKAGGQTRSVTSRSGRQEVALRWLNTTPSTWSETSRSKPSATSGSSTNPIDVDTLRDLSPQKLLGRRNGYREPPQRQDWPSRQKLVPRLGTPNGATIQPHLATGPGSHDVHKVPTTRMVVPAPPGFVNARSCPATDTVSQTWASNQSPRQQTAYQHRFTNVPAIYPMHLGYQTQRSYQYTVVPNTQTSHSPINGYPVYPIQNLEQNNIRKRAVQYALDYSRPHPQKRPLPEDPDETSSSEYKDSQKSKKYSARRPLTLALPEKLRNQTLLLDTNEPTPEKTPDLESFSTPSTGVSEENMFDRNLNLTDMVEHARLLTALLMAYPYSDDQKGLREDIEMLASVADKRLSTWLSEERNLELQYRKLRPESSSTEPITATDPVMGVAHAGNAGDLGSHARARSKVIVLTEEMISKEKEALEKRKRDEEVRRYLSADSDLWDKKDGIGVAAVYGCHEGRVSDEESNVRTEHGVELASEDEVASGRWLRSKRAKGLFP